MSYNSILIRLVGLKLRKSEQEHVERMTELFAGHDIKSFPDKLKDVADNCTKRIEKSDNFLIKCFVNSDARHISRQWHHRYEVSTIIV